MWATSVCYRIQVFCWMFCVWILHFCTYVLTGQPVLNLVFWLLWVHPFYLAVACVLFFNQFSNCVQRELTLLQYQKNVEQFQFRYYSSHILLSTYPILFSNVCVGNIYEGEFDIETIAISYFKALKWNRFISGWFYNWGHNRCPEHRFYIKMKHYLKYNIQVR